MANVIKSMHVLRAEKRVLVLAVVSLRTLREVTLKEPRNRRVREGRITVNMRGKELELRSL